MTVDEDIGQSTTLDNLTFGQSILSEQTKGRVDDIQGINFGQSFLLDENISPAQNSATEDAIGVKTIKTFDGTSIQLKKKTGRKNLIDLTSLGMKETDSIVNMDDLFNKIRNKKTLKQTISSNRRQKSPLNSQVWTEKYRPASFVQLCSAGNDRQYRLILHWLKKWSQVVFNETSSNDDNMDSFGRPHKKLLLIHGPLGIGKTSAAQILARQLGYHVQELNAANSMDTLPQSTGSIKNPYGNVSAALKLKIINALTTNSLTSNGKPTCLIIDEIDSSINSHEIVKVLNELIRLDLTSRMKNSKNGSTYNVKSDKKKKNFTLNRPIICIANDIYSSNGSFRNSGGSAMDKLRPLCEIIAMRKPSSYKSMSGSKRSGNASRSVKEHLMWINDREKLGMDYQQLGEIVEICEGDIRACINYLQFNSRKIDLVSNTLIQHNKDVQISWFAMVDLLFKRDPQLSKDENFMVLMDLVMNGDGKSATSNNGNLDKVIRGCFNKYLDVVRVQDDSLRKPSELSDWLSFYDLTGNSNEVEYYSSLVSMKIWSLFGELNPNKFSNEGSLIPNSKNLEFESFELMKQNKSIIKRIINQMPISLKQSVAGGGEISSTFACYFLPYLSKLLTPETTENKLKSNLKESEKRFVEKAARLTTEFDLRLENHRDFETGHESLHVSPNWDTITIFDSPFLQIPASTVHKQTQLKRQWLFPIITEEIERLEMLKKSHKRTIQAADGKVKNDSENKKKKTRLNSLEFFKGRYDEVASQINETDSNHELTRIWVKYNEGFSNAVRKNIGWNDIWI